MDMDQAAVFLAGSILFALGALIILGAILVANNLIAKYWKSWGWTWLSSLYPDRPPTRFMTDEEAARIAPHLDPISGEPHKEK
jgi:hypothetical protein